MCWTPVDNTYITDAGIFANVQTPGQKITIRPTEADAFTKTNDIENESYSCLSFDATLQYLCRSLMKMI